MIVFFIIALADNDVHLKNRPYHIIDINNYHPFVHKEHVYMNIFFAYFASLR